MSNEQIIHAWKNKQFAAALGDAIDLDEAAVLDWAAASRAARL